MQSTIASERTITYLRLSITDKCDLGCVYCVPYGRLQGCAASKLSVIEIGALVRAFALNGVTKVRITGGEPLVRDDAVRIVQSIAGIRGIETIGLTTNGTRLAECASDLARAGLKRVNISLDSRDRETFRGITGRDALHNVLDGLHASLNCGFERVKVNVVVMRGINDHEIPEIADLARELPVDVRFIELMPLGYGSAEWAKLHVPASQIREMLGDMQPLPFEEGSSARMYSLSHGKGRIGIISPMSEHFCGGCNRIRVTSSGRLKPCLRLGVEEDIRALLNKPDLPEKLGEIMKRLAHHKLSHESTAAAGVPAETMCSIGG